jgi:hypothetical protein
MQQGWFRSPNPENFARLQRGEPIRCRVGGGAQPQN